MPSFIKWSASDLRDIGVTQKETGNYFSGLDLSTACPEKRKLYKYSSFIKALVDMTVPYLFGNIRGYNILPLFILWNWPISCYKQLPKAMQKMYFLETAPDERADCLSVLGTFLYIFHKHTHIWHILTMTWNICHLPADVPGSLRPLTLVYRYFPTSQWE